MTDTDRHAILAMDNPDLDWGQPETTVTEQVQEDATVQSDTVTEQPATVEQTVAETPKPETVTTAPVDFGHIAKEIRDSERAKAEAMAHQAYIQGQQEALKQLQAQQQEAIEPPDMYLDPDGYAKFQRDQIMREVSPALQQSQAQIAALQNELLMAQAGTDRATLEQAYAFVQAHQPWVIAGLNQAPNMFKALIDHANLIGFQGQTQPVAAQPSQPVITDAIRQQVLAEEAAKRAAAGQQPQLQVPRGVGSTPAGAGHNDLGPPPISQWEAQARSNPRQWEQTREDVLKNLQGGAL